MNNIPKVIDLVVNNDLCIGCGLCTYKCPSKAIDMQWNEYGFFVPVLSGACNADGACITVCPFNPYPEKEVKTENEIADIFLKDATLSDQKIGKYLGIYAGYSEEFRLSSSSGGIATFVFTDLLERGIVNHIFSVKESSTPGVHYEYAVSNNKQELLAASKTRYYPVTLSTVFSKIDDLDGKVAIVGVACFIKAIRLAQHADPLLKEKIPFLIGIICGGIKSNFFTEYLSDKAGVSKDHYYKPEFRIKDLTSSAGDYSFACFSNIDNQEKTIKMQTVGDMWGTGLFKANACDFCDDVTTELADISLGDAWLEPFVKDGKGTNIVVTRSSMAEKIINDGMKSAKIYLETLPYDRFISSQQGSFNHRHTGLPYRISLATLMGRLIPPKRILKYKSIPYHFKAVQICRMYIRKKSLVIWKNTLKSSLFDKQMKKRLTILYKLTDFYHYKKALVNKFKLRKIRIRNLAMKIGILTHHYANNYGGVLQAYALCSALRKLGHQPTIINRIPNKTTEKTQQPKWKVAISTLFQNYFIKEFNKFRQNHLRSMTHLIDDEIKMDTMADMFDAVIVGSDQVWRMGYNKGLGLNNFLDFTPDHISKISYAASFGSDEFEGDRETVIKIRHLLSRFKAISVREDSGITLCKNLFDSDAIHVLDPTLLLMPDDYEKLIEKSEMNNEEKFIVQYLLDPTPEKIKITEQIAFNHKSVIKNIYKKSQSGFSLKNDRWSLSKFVYPSIALWISGIKNAEFVVTDSFHGVTFSILFNKQFVCIANADRGLSRMTSLLKKFELMDRLIIDTNKEQDFKKLPPIDYHRVNQILEKERKKSLNFLEQNLN
jgi:coenzyme F420-reducing hydrogenase beta subunit